MTALDRLIGKVRLARNVKARRLRQGISSEMQEQMIKLANQKRNRKRDARSLWRIR